ncbi:MAG: helix-turn-helix transcriptional regulator [Anaerolineae bacterium]|nr:helix-turn-helix transcriptional regulator [Anaerolineae bacterium]
MDRNPVQKADTLIRTKLHPPYVRPLLVARPGLQSRMMRGMRGPLTLITAPAGFGKTTLVASCIAGSGMAAAWLSLDKTDNQVGRFLNYLAAALHTANSAIGNEAAQLAALQAPPEAVLTGLINDLDAAGKEMILVLDDYQFITAQSVHEKVAFLLEYCPKTFHLVIASRSDPPLSLSRLRARGQIVEFRAADLRFTEEEAAQFLNDLMGLHLDSEAIAVLAGRTEGWVAGLQMAALSVQGRSDVDHFIREFAGTNRFIMDFMLEEVLARESKEIQTFLFQTAILTRLSGALCDAVTGASGGQEMLEALERRNLFVVPLDDERRWYRYHHLFADLLQARLNRSEPDRVTQLLSRAAGWCEQEGQVAEAVSYSLAAADYERAARLIAKYWGAIASTGEIETVWSWLAAMPEDAIRNDAPLGTAYCWMLWLTGQVDAIEAHLLDAESALAGPVASNALNAHDEDYATLPAELSALRAFVARYRAEFEGACALAERALSLIPPDMPPSADTQLRGQILLALASAHDGAGDLEEAVAVYRETIRLSRFGASVIGVGITIRLAGALRLLGRLRAADVACRDALEYVEAQGMARLPASGVLHVAMGEVLVEQNALESAEAHLSRGMELGKWSGRLDAARNAAPALSRLRLAQHDANGALAAIREAESALGNAPSPLAKAELLAVKARTLIRQGLTDEAAQCVEEATRLAGRDRGQTGEIVALAASRVRLDCCRPGEAIAQLTQSLVAAEARGWSGAALELRIFRSLALARQGDVPEAEADLERALAIAEAEGYRRVFLDEGAPMQALLARWLAHAGATPLRGYAGELLSQFDLEQQATEATQAKDSPTGDLIEPLSERELEILRLIASGKTNKDIARQLFIAPGTVKAHTASIYRKLDVANRTEAAARARQIGIL